MDLEGYSGNTVWDLDSTMVERYSSAILKYTLTIFGRNCDLRMVIVDCYEPNAYSTLLVCVLDMKLTTNVVRSLL